MNQNLSYFDINGQDNEEVRKSFQLEEQGHPSQDILNENLNQENNITNNEQKQASTQDGELTETKDENDGKDQQQWYVVQITQLINRKAIQLAQDEETCIENVGKQKYNILFKLIWQIQGEDMKGILIIYIRNEMKKGLITIDTHQKVYQQQEDIRSNYVSFNLMEVNKKLKELKIEYQFQRIFQYDEKMISQIEGIIEQLKSILKNKDQEKENESIQKVIQNLDELKTLCDKILDRKANKRQKNIFSFRKKDLNRLWDLMLNDFIKLKSELTDKQKRDALIEKILESPLGDQDINNQEKRQSVITLIIKQTLELIQEKEDKLKIAQEQLNKKEQSKIARNVQKLKKNQFSPVIYCQTSQENQFLYQSQFQSINEESEIYQDTPPQIFTQKKKTKSQKVEEDDHQCKIVKITLVELDREQYFEQRQQIIYHGSMEIEYEVGNNFEAKKGKKGEKGKKEEKGKKGKQGKKGKSNSKLESQKQRNSIKKKIAK